MSFLSMFLMRRMPGSLFYLPTVLPTRQEKPGAPRLTVERRFIPIPREEIEGRSGRLRALLFRGALRCATRSSGSNNASLSDWDNRSQ
jgi:hypothetical protein